jgi:GTP pyrophosphokinase
METLSFLKPHAQLRIARETVEIYAPIANRLGMGEVKGALEDLAFPILFPKEFSDLQTMIRETFEERKSFVEQFIPELHTVLAAENVRALDIHSRVKHWWSLWQKLQRKDMSLENVHDLVAVRAVFETVEQCYSALGAIHGTWRPLPGRIKDYVALPKSNGYRSLHTTVFGPSGKIVEIQLRTREMHEEAERGIAAHWAYGETKNRGGLTEAETLARSRDLAWIRQLREWHAEFEDAGEFLESLKIDFFKDRIFVFTPKGEVIDLPDGATPVDFAYHIHSDIGDRAVGAKVNGKMMALDSKLANGDIVEIQTQKNKKPSRQWLEFVKTSIARKHIQASVKRI